MMPAPVNRIAEMDEEVGFHSHDLCQECRRREREEREALLKLHVQQQVRASLIAKIPKFCRFCKDNEDIEHKEFNATFGEKVNLYDGKVVGHSRGNFLACECTNCGAIEEVKD
jgi:hypothetical protein